MNNTSDHSYIKVTRGSFNHWLIEEGRALTRYEAWLKLLSMVRYEDSEKKALIDNKLITWVRGQVPASLRYLQKSFNWASTSKVRTFLNLLESDQMIKQDKTQGINVITVCNFGTYNKAQSEDNTPRTHPEHTPNTPLTQNIRKEKKGKEDICFSEIVNFLNVSAGKNFSDKTKRTIEKIKARVNDGFKKEDFEKVIKIKCEEWKGNEMEKFLRPETLFGNKFESYLNQKPMGKKTQINNPESTILNNCELPNKFEKAYAEYPPWIEKKYNALYRSNCRILSKSEYHDLKTDKTFKGRAIRFTDSEFLKLFKQAHEDLNLKGYLRTEHETVWNYIRSLIKAEFNGVYH